MTSRQVVCLALLSFLPASLGAQDTARAGARVRIGTTALRTSAGLLLASSTDSLLVGFSDRAQSPVAVARRDVTTFQLSLREGDVARGAAIGAQLGLVIGAVAGGLVHLSSRQPPPRFQYDNSDLAYGALRGAAWGVVSGALAGAVVAQEQWADVALPAAADEALPALAERAPLQTQARLEHFRDGAAIRLRIRDGQLYEGTYAGFSNGSVRIAGDSSYVIPVSDVADIFERRPVTGSWARRGAVVGAAIGVSFVAIVALGEDCPSDYCVSAWAFAPLFGFYGAFTGTTVGAILGSHVKRWRPQKW